MSNPPGSPGEYQPGQWSGGQQPPPYPGGYGQQQPPPVWGGYPQPGQPGQPGGYGPPPGQAKGGFSALLDFEFNTFATPAVVKILYIVGIALIGLYYIRAVVVGFAQNVGIGLATLIVGGVVALFLLILFRVMLECYYAVARMSEDIRRKS
ncbi:MAG TPA: DUF4282 domain-containing protein [Pseudonocardiaceae bacterium]|nr:DUF4282 domain-containing protein [Pseudonocardiaceae bacterium]